MVQLWPCIKRVNELQTQLLINYILLFSLPSKGHHKIMHPSHWPVERHDWIQVYRLRAVYATNTVSHVFSRPLHFNSRQQKMSGTPIFNVASALQLQVNNYAGLQYVLVVWSYWYVLHGDHMYTVQSLPYRQSMNKSLFGVGKVVGTLEILFVLAL